MPELNATRLETRVLGNAATLIATQVGTKLVGTVFTIIVARQLGVEDYGLYAFAAVFGSAFGLMVAFGFPRLITRDVARTPATTSKVLGEILVLETIFSVLAIVVMMATLVMLGYETSRLTIVVIVGASMILNAVLGVVTAFFRAHQRMEWEALTRVTLSLLNMGVALPILLVGYGILGLSIAQFFIFLAVVLLAVALAARKLARPVYSPHWRDYRGLLGSGVPFAMAGLLIFVYDGLGVILLSSLRGDTATGLYSGAMNFVRVFGLIPASLVGAFLPAMAHSWQSSRDAWNASYQRSLKYLWIMALPISVGLALLSRDFVPMLLGEEYAASASILTLIAWMIVPEFLNHGFSNALISIDREKIYLYIVGAAVAASVAINLVLIPRWGAYGAAIAILVVEALVLIAQVFALSKMRLKLSDPADFLKPALSVAVMALGVYLIRSYGIIAAVLLGAAVYGATLFALHTFDLDEMAAFGQWWTLIAGKLIHYRPA